MQIDDILNPQPAAVDRKKISAALAITFAVAEAVRVAETIPAGTLYASLMDRLTLDGFNRLVQTLKNAGLVEERANVLRWIGPSQIQNAEVRPQ